MYQWWNRLWFILRPFIFRKQKPNPNPPPPPKASYIAIKTLLIYTSNLTQPLTALSINPEASTCGWSVCGQRGLTDLQLSGEACWVSREESVWAVDVKCGELFWLSCDSCNDSFCSAAPGKSWHLSKVWWDHVAEAGKHIFVLQARGMRKHSCCSGPLGHHEALMTQLLHLRI